MVVVYCAISVCLVLFIDCYLIVLLPSLYDWFCGFCCLVVCVFWVYGYIVGNSCFVWFRMVICYVACCLAFVGGTMCLGWLLVCSDSGGGLALCVVVWCVLVVCGLVGV